MQKLIIISLLLVSLSACTMPWSRQDTSFQGLYRANIHAAMTSFDELGQLLGVNRHENIEGAIHSHIQVPGILSGSLSSEYSALIDGRNSELFFRRVSLLYSSLVNSGSISADEIGFAGHGADTYVSYQNIVDMGMMSDDIKKVLQKYEHTWLALSGQPNLGMTPDELAGYNITRNLMSISLTDIEKYATHYPIWRDTVDLGMSGSLHSWSVELDRTQILSLAKQLSLDLTGTGMTPEYTHTLESSLAMVSFSGKISYDPADPVVSLLDGTLSASGKTLATISTEHHPDGGSITLHSSTAEKAGIIINYGKKENRYTFDATLSQRSTEMGKITGYIDHTGGKFHELSLEGSAQGVTVSLRHTVDGDHFTGKLSAVIGTLEWSGTTEDDQLKSLKINGIAPFGSLTADLIESTGGMVRGPVVIKSGTEVLMDATLALQMVREKFALIIDVLSESLPAHLDLDISAKSTPSDKRLTPPTGNKTLQDLMGEINALTPSQSFSEVPTSDIAPSDATPSSQQ